MSLNCPAIIEGQYPSNILTFGDIYVQMGLMMRTPWLSVESWDSKEDLPISKYDTVAQRTKV